MNTYAVYLLEYGRRLKEETRTTKEHAHDVFEQWAAKRKPNQEVALYLEEADGIRVSHLLKTTWQEP